MTDLIVALDFPTREPAEKLMKELKGLPIVFKVGLELFMGATPQWVEGLSAAGYRLFLDLKFHDIPNTVAAASVQAARLGVEMLTLHLAGGRKMVEAVNLALDQSGFKKPRILGVSVLTSFQQPEWDEVSIALTGSSKPVQKSVESLAISALQWGATGLVCSPHELENVKAACPSLYTVVPGIRPEGSPAQDQGRVLTPAQAAKKGASAIVVGRPVSQAENPRKMAEKILTEIQG